MEVWTPVTAAVMVFCPEGFTWLRTMPVLELEPLPAMVRLESVKELVRSVPSTETAVWLGPVELIVHGPMMYGSVVVPEPLKTQLQAWKSGSFASTIGACEPPAACTVPA